MTTIAQLYAVWVVHPWVCFGIGIIIASLIQELFNGIVKVIWAIRRPYYLKGKGEPKPEVWEDVS